MATAKSWTATDITMNTLRLRMVGTNLYAIHGYQFVDKNGDIIDQLPKRVVEKSLVFSSLPTDIQTALTSINAFMYQAALEQEGMDDN